MKFRDKVFVLLAGAATAVIGAAVAQEDDRMGQTCDWLKKSGIKFSAPAGADYTIKIFVDAAGTIHWNGQALDHRKALMDRVAEQKKQAKEFPATVVEAHALSHRASVQPVFRILNDARATPACAIQAPVVAPAPAVVAPAPAVEASAPAVETPAPAVEASAPAVETPAPAVEASAPAVEAPAPVVEASAPAVEAPAPANPG